MKKKVDVARAWRDEDYFLSLTEEERASLGAHPSGVSGLSDDILGSITGGCGRYQYDPSVETPCFSNCIQSMEVCTVCG